MTTGSKMKFSLFLAFILFFVSAQQVYAANTVQIRVDRNRLTTNDVLNCEVVVTLTNDDNVSNIQMPDFKGFDILDSRQSSQSSTQIINFKMSSQKTTTNSFMLAPQSAGYLTIGPASFMDNGRKVTSNTVRVQIIDVNSGEQNQQSRNAVGKDGIYADLSPSEKTTSDIFLRFIPERSEMMLGEQQLITCYIYYSSVTPQNLEQIAPPTFPGFSSDSLEMPQNRQSQSVVLGNRRYRTQPIARFILTARSLGKQTIPAYRLKVVVGTGSFFNNRAVFRATDPVYINVLPLPEVGQPAGFNPNNVGQFRFTTKVDRRRTEVGQPVTFNLVLTGNSNMDRIQLPKLGTISGVKIYPPTEQKDSSQRGNRIVGRRTAEYLLVPGKTGYFKIPSLKFQYFDSEEQQYKTITTREFTIQATESTVAQNGQTGQYIEKQALELKEGSLRPLVPTAKLENLNGQFTGSFSFKLLLAFPLFIVAAFLILDLLRYLLPRLVNRETLRKQAEIKQLKQQIVQKQQNPDKTFASDISRWIYLELEAAFGESMNGLTHDALGERLLKHNVDQQKVDKLFEIFNICEMALYTPSAISDGAGFVSRVESWFREVRS